MANPIFLLKIDGLDGDSTLKGYEKQISLDAFDWGLNLPSSISAPPGGGSGGGKPVMQPFQFTTRVSQASLKLMTACAAGQHFASAVLSVLKMGSDLSLLLKYTLTDVVVVSYHAGGNVITDPTPFDQVGLSYTKVVVEYRAPDPKGGSVPVTAGFDFKTGLRI